MAELFLVERQTVSKRVQCDEEEESCEERPTDAIEQLAARLVALPPLQLLHDLPTVVRDNVAIQSSCYAKDFFVLRMLQSFGRRGKEWTKNSIQQLVMILATECDHWALYHSILSALQDLSSSHDTTTSMTTTMDICLAGIELLLLEEQSVHSLWSTKVRVDDLSTFLPQVVVALPNRIARAYYAPPHRAVPPPHFVLGPFHTQLVATAAAMANNNSGSPHSRELVRYLLRRNGGEAVVLGLLQQWRKTNTEGNDDTLQSPTNIASFVAALDWSDREAAVWVRAVLRHHVATSESSSSSFAWMRQVCHVWIARCWETVCELVVLSSSSVMILTQHGGVRRPDARVCRVLAELLRGCSIAANDDTEDDEDVSLHDERVAAYDGIAVEDQMLWKCMEIVAQEWSSTQFIRSTDELLQQHVSCFLQHGLELLGEFPIENIFSMDLVQGVSERLKSSIKSVRLDGMRVGVVLAKLQGQELKFSELEEEGNEPQVELDPPVMPDIVEVTRVNQEGKAADEEPARFDLEDDQEDLLNVPKPLYLSECLDLLRTADSDEHAGLKQETALRHVSDLVRSRPADACEHAPELARTILRTRNRSHLDNYYSSLERTALCSLVTQHPRAVGLELIDEMFEDGTQNDRLSVLCALLDGAMELSGATALLDRIPPITETERVSGKGSFLLQRGDASDLVYPNASKTTRWGQGRRRNGKTVCIQNRFKEVGPIWFYALTKRFMETKDKSNLWGYETGSFLLSRWLDTLNGVMYCVGPFAPGIDIMVKDLWELSWLFREAEVPEVRLSVLRSFTTVLEFHQHDPSLAVEAPLELPRFLESVALHDPEENCRFLASSLVDGISTKTVEQPLIEAASTTSKKQVL